MRGLSPYSDPVTAGINAFTTMSKALTDIEERPLRRELLQNQSDREKLLNQKTLADMQDAKKTREREDKKQVDFDRFAELAELHAKFKTDPEYMSKATDKEKEVLTAAFKQSALGGASLQDLDKKKSAVETIAKFWKDNPQLQKGGIIDWSQYPDAGAAWQEVSEDPNRR